MLTATDLNNILRIERQRVKLQNQRNTAITKLKMLDPTYDPPACMKYKNGLLEQRIEVPQEEYPQHNFMGLILGPRGHYISKLQERTRTRIGIKVGLVFSFHFTHINYICSGQGKLEGWDDWSEEGWNNV